MKNTHTNGRGDSAARNLRNTLRHHVTGAIERGEKVAIVERTARNFYHGEPVRWRGVDATVQAWSEFPSGLHCYCTLTLGGILRAYWLHANDLVEA
jgi:hypothetical protein